jgi:hypothetical protein
MSGRHTRMAPRWKPRRSGWLATMKHEVEKAWRTCDAFSLGHQRRTRSEKMLATVAGNRESITPLCET